MSREQWNRRFAGDDFVYGTSPNSFLQEVRDYLQPGMRILCTGDGEGRNSVWLAGQGMKVRAVDYSARGLDKARQLATRQGVELDSELADLSDWDWPDACFDVVVNIFLHMIPEQKDSLHQGLWTALKPGGLGILVLFDRSQIENSSGGPKDPDMLYTPDEVKQAFPEAEWLILRKSREVLDEGPLHQGMACLIPALFRKPDSGKS